MPEIELYSPFPQFLVEDLSAAVDHYCGVLGFTHVMTLGEPPSYAIVRRGETAIHFMLGKPCPNRDARPDATDIYITCSDVDGLHAELTTAGAVMSHPLATQGYGMRDFAVVDPNGYQLAFGQEV